MFYSQPSSEELSVVELGLEDRTTRLIAGKGVWDELTPVLMPYRSTITAAIAYIGSRVAQHLPLSTGSSIIVDASKCSITSGSTDPRVLLAWVKSGVKVYSLANLHAKMILADSASADDPSFLAVGSANASGASANHLYELSEEDWSALRSLADRLDANPDAIGSWVMPEPLADGSTHVGYVDYGSLVQEFLEFMYANNLVIQFDWPGWPRKEAVQEGNVRKINTATPDDALKYLTVMIRADRFSEGALLNAFENGLVSGALHRVLGFQSAPNDDDVDRRGNDAIYE